mgnify:CR=1 FL=1
MITIPYIFLKDISNSYNKYKLCKDNKNKCIICMNNCIFKNESDIIN